MIGPSTTTVSGPPIRIGLQLAQHHADYATIRQAARAAEELGVDVLFNWDHFFAPGREDAQHFECWTMLGAWAESTSRVEFGPLVSCTSYRNPDLLADMARTVDHISGGRFILGVGAGFKERDFVEYGYEFASPRSRVTALEEALGRITRRLGELNPPPLRRIPILVGGDGERRMLRVVAEYADIWHTFAEGDVFARKARALDAHCAEIGRNPADIERSVLVAGDPETVGEPLRRLGVSLFVLHAGGPDYDLSPLRRWLSWRDERNG